MRTITTGPDITCYLGNDRSQLNLPQMQIKTLKKTQKGTKLLIVPFFKDYLTDEPKEFTAELKTFIKKFKKEKSFNGKFGRQAYYTVESNTLPEKIIFVGGGDREKYSAKLARELGALIHQQVHSQRETKISLLLTPELNIYIRELIEGIALKNYRISKYKTGEDYKKEKKREIKEVTLITKSKDKKIISEAKKALVIAQATNVTKDLVNGPANIVDASYFERIAKRLGSDYSYKVRVFNKDKLTKMKWGGLLAINQGAVKPAKCVILEHKGGGNKAPIIIVGKGLIFDTGGYNLKPTRHIEDMHQDKAGGSAVIGVFSALKELKIKQNVIGIIPLTENMIDGKAVRPSDVITMLNGKTVEIGNTDAEGRVILADALTYACKYKPKHIIDIATLTGSVMVALGNRYAGVFGNNSELNKKIVQAGEEVDELMWKLPIHEDHREKMKSKVADLRNADEGTSHLAGGSKAAVFLENFVEKNEWAHIDIAGTPYTRDPKKYEQRGATGAAVRTLINFLENL